MKFFKKRHLTGIIFAFMLLGVSAQASQNNEVVLDPNIRLQKFDGWGTSLCWWANVTGGWSVPNKDAIAQLLFGSEGLNFNIMRYNIGGGDAPGHNHMRTGAQLPGFKSSEDAPYDWDADKNQRWYLLRGRELGANTFEAFANSPPYWMTVSQCSAGHRISRMNNLKNDKYDAFASYLTDVAAYYRDTYDLEFGTISPFNEPRSGYWSKGHNQEGSQFNIDAQEKMAKALHLAINERSLSSKIAMAEETSINTAVDTWNKYSQSTKSLVDQINVHSYKGSDRWTLENQALMDQKKIWMSETDLGGSSGHNHNAIEPALALARRILDDVNHLGAQAWIIWQAVEDESNMIRENSNWGLIHADMAGTSESWHLTKKYYAMKQFSKYIPATSELFKLHGDDGSLMATYHPSSQRATLVILNESNNKKLYNFQASAFSNLGATASIYRTSSSENTDHKGEIPISQDGVIEITAPARSISTLSFSAISNLDSNLLYAVDCGNERSSPTHNRLAISNNLNNTKPDQAFQKDKKSGKKWGYLHGGSTAIANPNQFASMRIDERDLAGDGIEYGFELPNGSYDIQIGFKDPWKNKNREMDIKVEEELVDWRIVPSQRMTVKNYSCIKVSDGVMNIELDRANHVKGKNEDPMVSWIRVMKPKGTCR